MSPTAAGPATAGAAATGPPAASAALREAGREAWTAAVRHPMVAAIAAGTLPHRVFRGYFEQNVRYLEDYARAIALTAAKAPDRAALEVLSAFLRQIVATEIPANLHFLARLGGSASRLPGRPRCTRSPTPTPGTCCTSARSRAAPRAWPRCCRASGATGRSRSR